MTKEDKLKLIEQFENLSKAFDDVLELNHEIILFKPFSDAWSISEQIVHCVDFDVANFHRYRWSIVSPGTRVLSFDQSWTSILNYQSSDLREAVNLIKIVRKFMAAHLKAIVDDDWEKYSYTFGAEKAFDLEEALKHYIKHVGFHRELIDRNIKLYKDENKQ
jgi:hypothetical protein